jgi:thioredoxin-related protein
MSILKNVLTAGLVALAPAITFAAEEAWVADFDVAVEQARAEGKDLLVDFTGSDWCGWCIKLHDEVFSHAEFSEYAEANFVLVALDFPNGDEAKAKVPNPERNDELMDQYGVGGFPTILLMTPDGEVFGRTGYREGGPGPYVEHLQEFMTTGKAELAGAKRFVTSWEAATDENRMEVLSTIIAAFEGYAADSVAAPILAPIVKRALELDADNAAGVKLRAVKALLMGGAGDADVNAAAKAMDPTNEQGLYEHVVVAQADGVRSLEDVADVVELVRGLDGMGIKDEAIAERLYGDCAFWSWKYLDQKEDALAFADKCLALEPADPRLTMMLRDLLSELRPEPAEEEVVEVEDAE